MGDGLISPPVFIHQDCPGELLRTASDNSPNAACRKEQGQFSCSPVLRPGPLTQTTRASSTVLSRRGAEPSLPTDAGAMRGHQLSFSHALKAGSTAPLNCMFLNKRFIMTFLLPSSRDLKSSVLYFHTPLIKA